MRILLVEDDLQLGPALQRALQQAMMDVVWVRRCVDGLAHCDNCDAMLLDLTLPDGEGMDLLRDLRNEGCTLPIIVITARDRLDDRLRALEAGADDFLSKPFEIEEMIARLRAVQRRVGGYASDQWRLGPLRIDTGRHEVWREELPIELSRTEYRVLVALAGMPRQLVSKDRLHRRLYGDSDDGSLNALEVHIHNLRKKLGADLIVTVRGVGYRLQVD
ncbi:response regulator transcription factor family protein [Chitinimonas naiadis]